MFCHSISKLHVVSILKSHEQNILSKAHLEGTTLEQTTMCTCTQLFAGLIGGS